jgi:hypothetical protein
MASGKLLFDGPFPSSSLQNPLDGFISYRSHRQPGEFIDYETMILGVNRWAVCSAAGCSA